eukprot:SAG22_NODE_546_length_9261_cov_18.423925_11_plen_82_part_00
MAAELFGPVVTDPQSPWYVRAEKHTANTGELTGVIQACLWLLNESNKEEAALLYDSMYVADQVQGLQRKKKNVEPRTESGR